MWLSKTNATSWLASLINFIPTFTGLLDCKNLVVSGHVSPSNKKHHLSCKTYKVSRKNLYGLLKIHKMLENFPQVTFFIYSICTDYTCSEMVILLATICSKLALLLPVYKCDLHATLYHILCSYTFISVAGYKRLCIFSIILSKMLLYTKVYEYYLMQFLCTGVRYTFPYM